MVSRVQLVSGLAVMYYWMMVSVRPMHTLVYVYKPGVVTTLGGAC